MKTVYEEVEEIKSREKQELLDCVYKYGDAVDDGFEYRFESDESPIIACYVCDDPCDLCVSRVLLTYDGCIYLDGREKNNPQCLYKNIEPYDVFAGQLSYVAEEIVKSDERRVQSAVGESQHH